jgi:exodeoxyribonuclease VII large subunit
LDFLFAAASAPKAQTALPLKVWELVASIRNCIERDFRDVRVEGEISNLRKAASGHIYFTLKDARSQIPVVLFRAKARFLKFNPKDGMAVLARGSVSVYEDRGQVQLVAESIEPVGKGSLQAEFERLYAALKAEGLFDEERKRPLPAYPRVVGVITSPKGAVIHDILNVLGRRYGGNHVLLYPVAVQGDAAAAEVTAALTWFANNPCADVLIVARGGGSIEDLAAFNSEAVARGIAASRIPVVSAVGHETDFTIADFVADLRAPTPSAAAELITAAQYRVAERLGELATRLERAVRYRRMQAQDRLARLDAAAVFARMQHALAQRQQRSDELRFRLEALWDKLCAADRKSIDLLRLRLLQQDVRRRLALHQERLRSLRLALAQAGRVPMERRWGLVRRAHDRLEALSPLAVLDRGYALVYAVNGESTAGGHLVKNAARLHPGDDLNIRFARGRAEARVEGVIETERDLEHFS